MAAIGIRGPRKRRRRRTAPRPVLVMASAPLSASPSPNWLKFRLQQAAQALVPDLLWKHAEHFDVRT